MYSKAIKLALSMLLLGNPAIAQQRVEKIDILEGQKTYKNYVKNPSAIRNTNGTSVSSASIARDTDAADKLDGIASFNCDASALNGYCKWGISTINEGDKTGNCEVSATFKGDASLYSLRLTDGTNTLYDLPLKNQTDWGGASFNYPCGATRDVRLVQTSAGTAPAVNIGRIYYGPATNLVNISQAEFVGSAKQQGSAANCNYTENTSTSLSDFKDLGSAPSCSTSWVSNGDVSVSSPTTMALTVQNMKPGNYVIKVSGLIYHGNATSGESYFRIHDGSSALSGIKYASYQSYYIESIEATVTYTTSGTRTFKVQAADNHADSPGIYNEYPGTLREITWTVHRFPTQSELAVIPSLPSSPTIQRFTSGSGTYTTPQGVKYIKVKMVGGGGGGGGGGNGTGLSSTGNAGGNTSFGDWVAGGGSGGGGAGTTVGVLIGGAPTSNTVGTGTLILNSIGGYGLTGSWNMGVSGVGAVGTGGTSCVSGPVSTRYNGNSDTAGTSATGNTGNGGSGGGRSDTGYGVGSGGAGGSCLEFTMSSTQVGASKSFTVGIGGAGGAASSGTGSGGAGGSGVIIVEEYYHTENAPILVGSVTSGTSGAERIERARVGGASATTNCTSNPCTIYSSSGSWATSVTWASAGVMTINANSGLWTGYPSCTCSAVDSVASTVRSCWARANSTSAIDVYSFYTSNTSNGAVTNTNSYFDVICMGPK